MPRASKDHLAALAAILLLCAPGAAAYWTLEGRVVAISDGDTLTLLDREKKQHTVRLSGIDAPGKGQAVGARSRENLSRLVFDKQVQAHCHKKDRYGRQVCKVVRNATDVNLEQLRSGMAWWYRDYATEQSPEDRMTYAAIEERARASRIGFWKDSNPVPPWEWRKAQGRTNNRVPSRSTHP
jgi:endonuclease YncB( thermonuclease family)